MMTAVPTRRSCCCVRTLTALVLGFSALAGCGTHSTFTPGTPVITLSDTSGDFATYRVTLDSISLTDSNGAIAIPFQLTASEPNNVDLAALTDLTELLAVPAALSATYKSATLTLDYTNAIIWVNVNGQAVAAKPVSSTGTALTTASLTTTFDPSHPLVITQGQSTRLAIDFNLAASNSINTATTPPTVTVRPFVVMTPAPADGTVMRVRGLLVTVQSGSSDFVMNVRPLIDLTLALGAITVSTTTQTYFNVNGVTYTGAAGLNALASLPENTIIAAYGTLGDLSGITPGFHATSVYVGTSLESPLADHITGVVSARSANTLTVHGATLLSPPIPGINFDYTTSYANNATVTIGSATVVSEDGVAASGLTPAAISVGQQLDVSGLATVDTAGNISLDATASPSQVRLASTRIWGMLNSATAGSAVLDILSLGNFAPAGFNFAGTGTTAANPSAYAVNTGSLDESGIAAGKPLVQVDGIVNPFGSAPPDFTASAITAGTATEQHLVVEWINGGATAPFISDSTAGLVVDLNNAALGTLHEIRTGPATLDLKTLPASPLITTVGVDQSKLQLAIGSATLSTGVSVFNSISGFATAVSSTFNGTNKIYRLVASGQYNSGTNTFVASRISVALM
jgi:uncharacterized protein DUF4382